MNKTKHLHGHKCFLCITKIGIERFTYSGLAGCYPFTDKDPFLLETCPHVYFIGNQEKYETRTTEGTSSSNTLAIFSLISEF